MEFPERRTTGVLLTILIFVTACGIAYAARRVILLFVLSVFFAYLLNPAVELLQHRSLFFRNVRGAAVTRVYIAILILLAVVAYTFGPAVIRRTAKAVDQVPIVLDRLSTGEIANDIGDKYGWSEEQSTRVRTVLLRHKENFRGLQDWIDRSLSQAAQIAGWMALIPVLAIFFLRDGDQIVEAAILTFLPLSKRGPARMLASQIHVMLTNYMRAQVLLCLFSLGFYSAVLLLFRFPYAMALSVLGAMLEFIPVIGWMSTAALVVAVGLANDLHWAQVAVLFLLWRVAQDYFNLPRAIGRRLEIHPLVVIFAVLVGAEAGGVVGIYLAVPLVATLILMWKMRCGQEKTPPVQNAQPELPPILVR